MFPHPIPLAIRAAALLALSGVLFGFIMGGVFGFNEAAIDRRLEASGQAVLTTVYQGDEAAMRGVVNRAGGYLLRAHMHGGGIGAAALGAIATIVLMTGMGKLARFSAVAVGASALIYPVFWLVAGLMAPRLGGTDAAKDALWFLAVPGAGLALLGIAGAIWSVKFDRRTSAGEVQ